jgi:hypothetical protein
LARQLRRRRDKPRKKFDLRHLYGPLRGKPHLVAMNIPEPGGLLSSDNATLETGRRRDGSLAHPRGEREWVPPEPPNVIVIQNVRRDPLGQMYARRQIDYVRYLAGRSYQELYELAFSGSYGSSDPMRPTSHNGSNGATDALDRQRLAATRLRGIDHVIRRNHGVNGLFITRQVLVQRRPAGAGARSKRERQVSAFLFRSCLTLTAVALGLATPSIRREDREVERVMAR